MHNPTNIFVVAMGTGEIGQGVAFAKYAISRGAMITFAIFDNRNLPFLDFDAKNLKAIVIDAKVNSLNQAISETNPDVLVLCNSKILEHDGYCDNPPSPKPITVSIDSNWLFSNDSPWKFMPWADTYCINIPKPVFDLGLKQNGGNYDISPEIMEKIKVIGLVPSYEKISDTLKAEVRKRYGILDDEKFIFMYASPTSLSASQQIGIYLKAINSVRLLVSKGHRIKILNVGNIPQDIIDINEPWLMNLKSKDASEFYNMLASSDLVFQHQGLGTLEQAIAANVPIIASVKDHWDEEYSTHAHEWEISPFARFGACGMLHFSGGISESADMIEKLLYDTDSISNMKTSQLKLYESGESRVFNEIVQLFNLKNNV